MSLPALLVAGAALLPTAAAQAETRTLTIYHIHTKDTITATFKRNGRYDEDGLAQLNTFLRDWRNQAEIKMDPRLFDVIWEIYQEVGASEPIQIISAYRSPATNSMLRRRSRGVARFSQHMLGRAIDFNIRGVSLEQVRNAGLRKQRGGVGFYPSSGAPFVHVDVGNVRHWPRLPPAAYARVMRERALTAIASRSKQPETVVASRNPEPDEARQGGGRNWFSRMFAGAAGQDGAQTATRGLAGPQADPEPVRRTTTAAVPTPRPAPATRAVVAPPVEAAPATASPPPPAPPASSPAQVVQARGLWNASDMIAASEAAPKAAVAPRARGSEPRLVWQVGPQPVAGASDASAMAKRVPTPRSRPAPAADTTASLPPWPIGEREDRVPSDLVLAYAAPPQEEPTVRPAPAAPMGALKQPARSAGVVRAKRPERASAPATTRQAASASRLLDNPWLRGVIMAPSVHDSMGVTVLGSLNHRALQPLMHKPKSAVANTFADDADFGMSSTAFSGEAVAFVPTVVFGRITAGLR